MRGKSKSRTDRVSEFATVRQEVQRQSINCSGVFFGLGYFSSAASVNELLSC